MNLDFFVANRTLTAKCCTAALSDTVGQDTFTVSFDKQWDGLVKIVVLQNGENKVRLLYTGKAPIPRQVCGRGELYLTCFGYRGKDDGAAVICTKPMIRPVRMIGAVLAQADTAQPVTPSLLEQMTAVVAKAEEAAEQARQIGSSLKRLQEQGAFQGAPGPAGLCATVQVDSVRHGEVAKVENLGTERNALLRFTIPYKLTQEELELLQEQLVGDLDETLDHILALQNGLTGGDGV